MEAMNKQTSPHARYLRFRKGFEDGICGRRIKMQDADYLDAWNRGVDSIGLASGLFADSIGYDPYAELGPKERKR
jgi:hypothetical protein